MRRPLSPVLGLALGLLVLAAGPRRAAAQEVDPYDEAFARAAVLEAAGKFTEAAQLLEAGLWYYPQDFALPLRIAWLHRRAGRLADAERFYRLALARSPAAVDARVGLDLVLEAERRAVEVTATLTLTGTLFPDHPYKALAGGAAAGLGIATRSGWSLGGTYRYTRFSPTVSSTLSAWDQHEGYFHAGWGAPEGGLLLHYAVVADGSGVLGTSHHAGVTVRWSPFGDIEVRVAGSFYGDMKVVRAEPSWRIPIAGGLSVRPGVGLADAGGEFLPTGMATLALDRPRFSLWAGGKYGDEVRPVYLSVPVVYDVTERIPYGAWAGASVNVSDDVRIHLSYAMDRLKQPDAAATSAHTLALGTAVTF